MSSPINAGFMKYLPHLSNISAAYTLLDMLTRGQQTQITPEQADEVPPEAVEEIAAQAEKRDPSVIDQVSNFYAEHPTLVKTLGAAALAIALSQIAKRQTA